VNIGAQKYVLIGILVKDLKISLKMTAWIARLLQLKGKK
jgi:hypothetical protein